jgi:hypothetical protein
LRYSWNDIKTHISCCFQVTNFLWGCEAESWGWVVVVGCCCWLLAGVAGWGCWLGLLVGVWVWGGVEWEGILSLWKMIHFLEWFIRTGAPAPPFQIYIYIYRGYLMFFFIFNFLIHSNILLFLFLSLYFFNIFTPFLFLFFSFFLIFSLSFTMFYYVFIEFFYFFQLWEPYKN